MRSSSGSTPRTRGATSCRRLGRSSSTTRQAAPASGWTRTSTPATRSPRTTTRCSRSSSCRRWTVMRRSGVGRGPWTSSPSSASKRRCRCTWRSSRTRSSGGAGSIPISWPRGSSGTKAASCGSPQPAPPPLRLLFGRLWGRRLRVRAQSVHALDPELAQEDGERGHQGDGEQDADEAEEGPHYQQREHHDRGVEGDGPAHYDRLYQVGLDRLDRRVGEDHPEGVYGCADQRQEQRRDHRDQWPHERYEGDEAGEDPEQQREGHPDQVKRHGREDPDEEHRGELANEPPLDRLVQFAEDPPHLLPPPGWKESDEPVDERFGLRDGVDGGYDDHDDVGDDARHARADVGHRHQRAAREEVARRIHDVERAEAERGPKAQSVPQSP